MLLFVFSFALSVFDYSQAFQSFNNRAIVPTSFHHPIGICNVRFHSKPQTLSAIRLLIQGTKNAYTNLQKWDVVLYQIPPTEEGQTKSLGYLNAENMIQPLCVYEEGDAEFHPDLYVKPMSAQKLVDEKKLLRILSSDRAKGVFSIDEYLDDDIFIPVREPFVSLPPVPVSPLVDTQAALPQPTNIVSQPTLSTSPQPPKPQQETSESINDSQKDNRSYSASSSVSYSPAWTQINPIEKETDDIDIVQAQLKVALLELKLLRLQKHQQQQRGGGGVNLINTSPHASTNSASLTTRPTQAAMSVTSLFATEPSMTSTGQGTSSSPSSSSFISPLSSSSPSISSSSSSILPSSFQSPQMIPVILSTPSASKVTITKDMMYISGVNGVDAETYSLSKTGIQDDFMRSIQSTFTFETQTREAFKNLKTILQQHCVRRNIDNNGNSKRNNDSNSNSSSSNSNSNSSNNSQHDIESYTVIDNPIYRLTSITAYLTDIDRAEAVRRIYISLFTPSIDIALNDASEGKEMRMKLPVLRCISSAVRLAYEAEIEIDAMATLY